MKARIFNIQRFSLFDGPGIRTVVFLKGCPLDCVWCHNPEGKSFSPEIMFDAAKCIGCNECEGDCPKGLHLFTYGIHTFEREGCNVCGKCTEGCYSEALKVAGEAKTAEEVIDEVMKDFALFKESGGGMTVSGGEPLSQAVFTAELLRLAKKAGIDTCVETSGYGTSASLLKTARYTDLFLFDCKHTNNELHKKYCGVSNKVILRNLALLNEHKKRVILSCPIVPGCNDTDEHIKGIGELARKYDCIESVKLEPYHRLGVGKSVLCGMKDYFDTEIPSESKMTEYAEKIRKLSGKPCVIG